MAGSLTVVLISKKSDTNDSIVLGDQALNTQLRIDYSGLNELALTPIGSTEAISGNFSNASTVLRCQIARRESSVNPNTSEFRENKTYRGGGAFDAGVHNMTWSLVGSAFFGGFNYNGDIAELCIYSQFQTNSDLDALYDNYFKPRWGLP
jgi:hypothetical protein